jgi:putative membrane protein
MNNTTWRRSMMLASVLALASGAPLTGVQAEQAAASPPPSDAEIAAIVVAANQVDIDAGKLAADRAQSADVRTLAQRMVTDHTGVNQQASALVEKLHVTPKSNATSESLARSGDQNLKKLRGLSGTAFDQAYVSNEVTYHQTVIDALDQTLIPSAKNAELRDLLVKVRPAFVSHLEHAKHLQSKLEGGTGSTK